MMTELLWALGLVMVIEGLAYVLAPNLIFEMLKVLSQYSIQNRRMVGAIIALIGALILWAMR
ncbi:DUF2065 domain-containing protein [Paracoccaceae bacterium]|jgi:uncharacterized protein YjeT (DUF2065 family)|nr:DUF2065 domain-containing protein [Paracoccaceae bacterium]